MLDDNQKLQQEWDVFEFYGQYQGQQKDFFSRFEKVLTLITIRDLIEAIAFLPLGNPFFDMFPDVNRQMQKQYNIQFENNQSKFMDISGVAIFKKGITPQWEDEKNQNGMTYRYTFALKQKKHFPNAQEIDDQLFNKFWVKLLIHILSGYIKNSSKLNGIQLMLKQNCQRLEFWMSSNIQQEHSDFFSQIYDLFKQINQIDIPQQSPQQQFIDHQAQQNKFQKNLNN